MITYKNIKLDLVMRKIAFLLCATAMLGTMTSCHRSTDDSPTVTPVVVDKSRTLIVSTNVAADIVYDGQTIGNTTDATFRDVAAQGKLKITPRSADYYDQDEMAIDFYDQLTLYVDVQLVKKPSIEVSQEDAKNGQVVTNDAENQNATGAVATITVPSDEVVTGNTTDPYSIVTFLPAETVLESTGVGSEVEASVLVIRCKPDGAVFNPPLDVTVYIENSTGFDLECVGEDESEVLPMTDLQNDTWHVKIPHFCDWFNNLRAIVVESSAGEEVTTYSIPIVAGTNTIEYKAKTGALETSTTKCRLVTSFINRKFGKYREYTKKATFASDAAGFATVRITQPYRDVTLRSNIRHFSARVYREPTVEIISTSSQEGHSGGSIN